MYAPSVCRDRHTHDRHMDSESILNNFFKVLLLSICNSVVETGYRLCEEMGWLGRDTGITAKLIIKEFKQNRLVIWVQIPE